MEIRSRRHERGSNWTDPEIEELLQLWSDDSVQLELESSLRNQRVFDRIARVLHERGIYRTGDQCREKIKKMRLEYRRIKENHKHRSWKFFDVMDQVLSSRPALNYSTVIAQHIIQNQAGAEGFQAPGPAGPFGPTTSGGFLFGHPQNAHGIKSENVDSKSVVNSTAAPPEMYYASEDEHEAEGQSVAGQAEEATGQEERAFPPITSPSAVSEANTLCSAATGMQGDPAPHEQGFTQAAYPAPDLRPRKRRLTGRAARQVNPNHPGLDRALVGFLEWQQAAEERLLALEAARLERELLAEERREQREERRAEQEREHELRLFSMLTGTLHGARPEAHAAGEKTAEAEFSHGHTSEEMAFYSGGQRTYDKPCGSLMRGGESAYLSNRGNAIWKQQSILNEGFLQYGADKYHQTDNPGGIINMGTSENKLCYDILLERLAKSDMQLINSSLLQYGDWTGHAFLREEVAKFLTDFCCSPHPLKPENVVVMNGCCSLFSCIAAVICDPKDAMLIPTPFYGVISEDLDLYADVKLFHVPLDCEENESGGRPFHLTVDKLEEGLRRANQEGISIRALILMNPHNPLAEIYTQKEMIAFLEFAKRYELHVIVDEVYQLTVFGESAVFQSVLSLESLPDPKRTHVMWGMGKDFAMAGIRIGTLYSENRELLEAMAQLGCFHGIPGPTQLQVVQLLRDREWINNEFLPENRRRLRRAHSLLTNELRSLGIPFLDRPATLFVWADLRQYLREFTFEDELSLWRCFLKHKVVLSCGQAFYCSTPGWFRLVFADQQHHLELGLRRMKDALTEIEQTHACPGSSSVTEAAVAHPASADEDYPHPDNPAFVHRPQSKSPHARIENGTSAANDGMDALIGTLKHQMHASDWLQKNAAKIKAGEDPRILETFMAMLQRARK